MRLSDVRHQPRAHDRLQRAISAGRVPHAWLFAGPEGVGRRALAVSLARLLLCPHAAPAEPPADAAELFAGRDFREACGRCEDCTLFDAGTHPDFHEIHRGLVRFHPDPAVRARKAIDLSIDVIRHFLIGQLGHRPARGRAKVFVVDEAERLSIGAQNALLKTLEEPPDASYLILITRSDNAMLPTTRSRCQLLPFGSLPPEFVAERLLAADAERPPAPRDRPPLSPADARWLAHLSGGSAGLALRYAADQLAPRRGDVLDALAGLADDPLAFGRRLVNFAKDFAERRTKAEPSGADTADDPRGPRGRKRGPVGVSRGASGVSPDVDADADESLEGDDETEKASARNLRDAYRLALAMVACHLRDVLRMAAGAAPAALDSADPAAARLPDLAARFGRAGAARALRAVSAAEAALEQNANANLVFDALAIEAARSVGSRVYVAI